MLSNNVPYTAFTAPTKLRLSPFAGSVEQTLHAIRVPREERMCGTNTYLLVLYNAINWLLPHSSKTLPGGVIPQTLSCGARRVWGPDYCSPTSSILQQRVVRRCSPTSNILQQRVVWRCSPTPAYCSRE